MSCNIFCSDNGITSNAVGYRSLTGISGDCPWTGEIKPYSTIDNNACTCKWSVSFPNTNKITSINDPNDNSEDTTLLGFSDPWIPPRSVDPSRNFFAGTYEYKQVFDNQGNTNYELEVIPTFGNLTWTGSAVGCGKHTKESCSPASGRFGIFWPTYANVIPWQWAGYSTDTTISNGGVLAKSNCKSPCDSGENLVLCTRDKEMRPKSCPGYNKFTNPPTVVPVGDYYSGLNVLTDYPRGKGKCLYKGDTIQTPNDMKELLALRNEKKIHPGLADELAKNYCYKSSDDNKCGIDSTGRDITRCTNLAIEMNNSSGPTPCKDWINTLKQEGKGDWIDDQSRQWCNDPDNAMTPLCDCFMARYNNGTAVRNFYNFIKGYDVPIIKSNVPDVCWYTPCMANTYAMKSVVETCNIDVAQICQNIIYAPDADAAFIKDNKQSLNCNIDVQTSSGEKSLATPIENYDTSGGNTQGSSNITDFLTKPIVYIPLIFMSILIIISIIIKSFSSEVTMSDEKIMQIIESKLNTKINHT